VSKFENELTRLGLSVRVAKVLENREDVTTRAQLEALMEKGDWEVMKIPNIAQFTLDQIKLALKPKEKTAGRKIKGRVRRKDKNNLTGAVVRDEFRDIEIDEVWLAGDKPVANVGYTMGYTINKGDYESVRIDCSLYVPCYSEEVTKVQARVKAQVEDWLGEAVMTAKRELGLVTGNTVALEDRKHENAPDRPSGEGETQKAAETPSEAQERPSSGLPWEGDSPTRPAPVEAGESIVGPINGEDFDLMKELGIV